MSDQGPTHRAGVGAVADDELDLLTSMGGVRGIIEAVVPTLLFVVSFVAVGAVMLSAGLAVAACAVAIVARLVQRQTIAGALGGAVAAAVGGVLAVRSGQGEDFYVPGLLYNAAYAVAMLVSILVRFPLVGVILGLLVPAEKQWRDDPVSRRTARNGTWVFFALFAAKSGVQGALYLAGSVVALGVAKIVMGIPLFAVAVLIVWRMYRRRDAARAAAPERPATRRP